MYIIWNLPFKTMQFCGIKCVKMLNNHHVCLLPERFLLLKEKTLAQAPPSCLPQPLATIMFLLVSVDLPSLYTSYKWNCILCEAMCLASFSWHNFFFLPCHTVYGILVTERSTEPSPLGCQGSPSLGIMFSKSVHALTWTNSSILNDQIIFHWKYFFKSSETF